MNQRHYPDHIWIELVDETITGVGDYFASARNDAGRTDFGVLGYSGSRFSEAAIHFESRFGVFGVKVVPNIFTILYCIFSPDNLHP